MGGGGVNLVVVAVDPQLERHPPSKLVSFASDGNVVGMDLALDVDVLVDGDVQELDCHQRLRVVHLQEQAKGPALNVHFYSTLEAISHGHLLLLLLVEMLTLYRDSN